MSAFFEKSSVVIYGFGREGQSVFSFLRGKNPQQKICICDKNIGNIEAPLDENTKLISESDFLENNISCSKIYRSPGIPISSDVIQKATQDGAALSSLSNLFFENAAGIIIGITGTKGKSTTSALLAEMLKTELLDVRLVGNIGSPALDSLEGSSPDTVFVYELSSFQLEDLSFGPSIAILLGIYPEHLDHHGSFEAYQKAKFNIFNHQSEQDFLICNSKHLPLELGDYGGRVLCFSTGDDLTADIFVRDNKIFERLGDEIQEHDVFSKSKLLGQANRNNILAATCAARLMEVSWDGIAKAIEEFVPLAHRLEFIGTHKEINFYNDSLATIPEATILAIEAIGAELQTLIAGGFDRGISYQQLGTVISDSQIENLILLPTTGEKIAQAVFNQEINIIRVSSMEEAVAVAFALSDPGKTCVLSPASSSLNMFKDYRERGERFCELVKSS